MRRPDRVRTTDGPVLSRRDFLGASMSVAVASLAWPGAALAESPAVPAAGDRSAALAEARTSPLVYVSPLKKNGEESACHGEVWFVKEGDDLLVVTDAERWRASCIRSGLDRARLWVGDHGVWTQSKGAFRSSPSYDARASIDTDRAAHARALESFGKKYADSWDKWGPRFAKGLASGDRVLIRYTPAS